MIACDSCKTGLSSTCKLHSCLYRVIDVLPKQWGSGATSDFLQQLQDKEALHQKLLAVLEEINVLHVLDPHALRYALVTYKRNLPM